MSTTASRTSKVVTNIKVALIFYAINLLLQFVSRKVFIDFLGAEVLGLNTTASNLLGFLNIAELGVGAAVAVNLYRPLYKRDREAINAIASVQGWLYRKVAWIVIAGAAVMMCFFPRIFNKADVPLWYTYGTFGVLLLSSLLGYFVNYRQIVLTADQKEYKVTIATQSAKTLKVSLQILAVSFFEQGYIWWMALEGVFAFVTAYALDRTIKKEYPWLETDVSKGKELSKRYPAVITKTKQTFFHKIGGFVLTQTTPLVIYGFTTLTLVAVYGNYLVIVNGLKYLVDAMLNGMTASVGNLVAEGNRERIKNVFWELTVSRMWIAAIICFAFYMLGDSFITLWVGVDYILPKTAFIVLVINTFIHLSRTNDAFINAYGIFQDIWAPIAEAGLNLGLSILFGHYFGLTGVLTGVCISQLLIIYTWKPIFLYWKGFKEKFTEYPLHYAKYLTIFVIAFLLCRWSINEILPLQSNTFSLWAFEAISTIGIYGGVSAIMLFMSDMHFRTAWKRLIRFNKRY